jgi:hypothetical protein
MSAGEASPTKVALTAASAPGGNGASIMACCTAWSSRDGKKYIIGSVWKEIN